MFFLRKLGKFLRGNATPFQIMAACLLGGILAFLPGPQTAPGLVLGFTLLLILVNANLFLAGLILLAGKLIALALIPITFAIGRFLLDGPVSGLFSAMINGPVTAWFGFEYYITTGGLLMGLVFGSILGFGVVKSVTKLRQTMAGLEENSERYHTLMAKRWVKIAAWLLVGGVETKQGWSEMGKKKIGNPIRPIGAALVVVTAVFLFVAFMFLDEMILRTSLQSALERVNGATVDIESVELDAASNRLTITGLAMADRSALDRNVAEAEVIEADISGMSLLSRKVAIDRLELTGLSHGKPRSIRGQLVVPEVKEPKQKDKAEGDGWAVGEVMENAQAWRERLAQLRDWLDRLSGAEEPETEAAEGESLAERLAREAEAKGYARVRAEHLISGRPTLTIFEIVADKVTVAQLPEEILTLQGENVSTHPYLLDAPMKLEARTASDKIFAQLLGASDSGNALAFHYRELPVNRIGDAVSSKIQFPLKDGMLDLQGEGALQGSLITMPLKVEVRDTEVTFPGIGTQTVSQLSFPVEVSGPVDSLRIRIEGNGFKQAVASAAKGKFKELLNEKAGKLLEGSGEEESDVVDKAKSLFKDFIKKDEG